MTKSKLNGTTLKVGSFLEEFEKDNIKNTVNIVSLFNDFGVKLEKKGSNYMGCCPWHDDKTPSLSVDRTKGLYNCFGCGESGDVFNLVMKMKGLDFKEACNYLKQADLEIPENTVKEKPVLEGTFKDNILQKVRDYYCKELQGNNRALNYLSYNFV